MIDWNSKLEAVHEDGRVVPCTIEDGQEEYDTSVGLRLDNGDYIHCKENGTPFSPHGEWIVRNRLTTIRTAAEQLERMEALVRRMADRSKKEGSIVMHGQDYSEARAIVAELPPVVDPDLATARKVVQTTMMEGAGKEHNDNIDKGLWDESPQIVMCLDALRRAREEGVKS